MKISAITATAVLLVPAALHAEGKGVVNTYPAVSSCMSLDYDPVNGWIWQASSANNNGEIVTVDPEDGSFTHSFYVPDVVGTAGLEGNGVHYDEDDQYLYLTDSYGDSLATYGDAIYCFDVSDPQNPGLVDVWDLGSLDGILGITVRGSSFYCVFGYGDDLRKLSLSPGGGWTVEHTYVVPGNPLGGIYYNEDHDLFYSHDAEGSTIRVLDGANPLNEVGSFSPGCSFGVGIAMVEDFYIWGSSYGSNENYVIEDEHLSFEGTTWGAVKAAY
ncbi:MAG: hypothetical protein R6U36_11415 [Candidatus Fermentibacteraceae bacterium]